MVEIRTWQQKDIDAYAALVNVRNVKDTDIAWSVSHYLSSFESGHLGLVAVQEQQVVGCLVASLVFEVADLLYIHVSSAVQRSGIAQKLLNRLVLDCRERNVERIVLEVRRSNRPALGLYRKMKFIDVAVRKAYYSATQYSAAEDAVILQLNLSDIHESK